MPSSLLRLRLHHFSLLPIFSCIFPGSLSRSPKLLSLECPRFPKCSWAGTFEDTIMPEPRAPEFATRKSAVHLCQNNCMRELTFLRGKIIVLVLQFTNCFVLASHATDTMESRRVSYIASSKASSSASRSNKCARKLSGLFFGCTSNGSRLLWSSRFRYFVFLSYFSIRDLQASIPLS